jgi:hypothetical protein
MKPPSRPSPHFAGSSVCFEWPRSQDGVAHTRFGEKRPTVVGHPRHIEIGDIVTRGRNRFRVCGFDPIGVESRFVYLEDTASGTTMSVTFDDAVNSGASPHRQDSSEETRPKV